MDISEALTGPARRLAEELAEDGVTLPGGPDVAALVIDELDHARRIPVFEGRRPVYGSFVLPHRGGLDPQAGPLDILDLDGLDLGSARSYADGRSAFLLRCPGVDPVLACFDRSVQYEADLVRIQELTGAEIIQRTPVLRAVRLFTRGAVVAWDGRNWIARPTASAVLPALRACAPGLRLDVARGLLDLAVHWLAPARIGASLVVYDADVEWGALDMGSAARTPALSLTNHRHFPALFAALQQHDLAVLVSAEGRVGHLGVGLLASPEATSTVTDQRGMRHRSAQRFSFDQPSATVVVVSEDGPVTVFRGGRPIEIQSVPCV